METDAALGISRGLNLEPLPLLVHTFIRICHVFEALPQFSGVFVEYP